MDPTGKALAERHVAKGRAIVTRQREPIARLRALDANTEEAVKLLELFKRTLKLFENDLAAINRDDAG